MGRQKKGGRGGASKVCACSRRGVLKLRGGWLCAGCLALERKRDGTGTRRQVTRVQSPLAKYGEWMFQAERGRKTPVVDL